MTDTGCEVVVLNPLKMAGKKTNRVPTGLDAGVLVAVAVEVTVGVAVAVSEPFGVSVIVGLAVGVGELVGVPVDVGVLVWVGVDDVRSSTTTQPTIPCVA
jgi:hypothetical protein